MQTAPFDPTRPVETSKLIGTVFTQDGVMLDGESLRKGLEQYPDADRHMRNSQGLATSGILLGAVSGGLLAWGMGAFSAQNKDTKQKVLGASVGLSSTGLVLALMADSQATRAVAIHNAALAAGAAACGGKGRIDPAENWSAAPSGDRPEYVSTDGRSRIRLISTRRGEEALGDIARRIHDGKPAGDFERVSEPEAFESGRTPGILRIFRTTGPPPVLINTWVFAGEQCVYQLESETEESAYDAHLEALLGMAQSFREVDPENEPEDAGATSDAAGAVEPADEAVQDAAEPEANSATEAPTEP